MKKRATLVFEYDNFVDVDDSVNLFRKDLGSPEGGCTVIGVVAQKVIDVQVEAVKSPAELAAEELVRNYNALKDVENVRDYALYDDALEIFQKWFKEKGIE